MSTEDDRLLAGKKFGVMLCEAFGLDPMVTQDITIECALMQPAVLRVGMFVLDSAGKRTADRITREFVIGQQS